MRAVDRKGFRVLHRRVPRLFDELRLSRADGTHQRLLARIAKADVLVLDDFAIVPLTEDARRELLEILEDRYGGIKAEASLFGGAFDGCIGSHRARVLEVATCSRTEVGSLHAEAIGFVAGAESRLWLTTGAVVRARVHLVRGNALVPNLELAGGALAAMTRDRFYFEGSERPVIAPARSRP